MVDKKYTVEPFSVEKIMAADGAFLNKHVKLMQCLFEIDIAPMRKEIREVRQRTKKNVSILACLLYCYGKALDKNKESLALKGKGKKLFRFENADAFFPIEIKQDDKKLLWCKIIRGINNKTVFELEEEIKDAASITKQLTKAERIFFNMPDFVRNWFYNYMMRTPLLRKQHGGNVYFSSSIHSGNGRILAYGIPSHFHTTGMFIGMFRELTNNDTEYKANILGITLSLDHIIGDGYLLAKLFREFVYQVENFTI